MSTDVYLSRLDPDQLRYARDRASALIAEKEKEQKKLVWCVEDRDMALSYFPAEQYLEAAQFLMEHAQAYACNPDLNAREKELRLAPIWVIESEYADYVSMPRS